jgi:hypothetical protein
MSWMNENSFAPGNLDEIGVEAEFGADLTYSEAIEPALQKFPTFWKNESTTKSENKPKQIIFVNELIQKISEGKVSVANRKSPKVGMYYVMWKTDLGSKQILQNCSLSFTGPTE